MRSPPARSRVAALGGLVALAVLGGATPARAGRSPDRDAARPHERAAREALARGDRDRAILELVAAHDHCRVPTMLRAIAELHEAAGRPADAVAHYRRYLAQVPGAPDGPIVRDRVDRLLAAAPPSSDTPPSSDAPPAAAPSPASPGPPTGAGAAAPPAPAAVDPAPDALAPPPGAGPPSGARGRSRPPRDRGLAGPPPTFLEAPPRWQRTAAWVAVATAATLGTAGAVTGAAARSRQQDLEHLATYRDPATGEPLRFEGRIADDWDDSLDRGERLDRAAGALLVGAGAAAVAAAVFFLLDPGDPAPPEEAVEDAVVGVPWILPGAAGIGVRGRF